jgi:hypothetical protein
MTACNLLAVYRRFEGERNAYIFYVEEYARRAERNFLLGVFQIFLAAEPIWFPKET